MVPQYCKGAKSQKVLHRAVHKELQHFYFRKILAVEELLKTFLNKLIKKVPKVAGREFSNIQTNRKIREGQNFEFVPLEMLSSIKKKLFLHLLPRSKRLWNYRCSPSSSSARLFRNNGLVQSQPIPINRDKWTGFRIILLTWYEARKRVTSFLENIFLSYNFIIA